MIALDTNVLVYAHRSEMPWHNRALEVVRNVAEGRAPWAIPWPCAHEFLAVVTNPKPFKNPTSPSEALEFLCSLVESNSLQWLAEGPGYLDQLKELLAHGQVIGGRVHDARIAALCLYHGVSELWSADRDFSAFPQLKVRNPFVRK